MENIGEKRKIKIRKENEEREKEEEITEKKRREG